ncbi:MAG: SDR family oxidoreductase [Burkholderiaceae bacterium]
MSESKERVALLTGGSSGIGAAIAARLAEAGYTVLALARRPSEPHGGRVVSVPVDLADRDETRGVVSALAARYPITTIVHNAGVIREKPLEQVTPDDLDALTGIHVATAITLVQANVGTMKQAGYGRIVLMSTRAVLGLANRTVYSATKAALLGLSRTWALELGGFGITSNAIAPGPIADTEMFHEVIPADSPKIDTISQAVPVKRLGRPDDVARAVMFFVSPDAGFVTGQTLFVCGGTSVGSITY